jgi:alkylation response protein AidB-like acyl-CoA dehydrogenase
MLGRIGVTLAAPVVNAAGSEWQRTTYLEPLLRGDEVWCQGFSEPDAGSDLAGLRTRAEERDGVWILNGQKVWSSTAHLADRSFALARTRPDADPPHHGIGYFIVDLKQPGVEVRPIRQINGSEEFSEIFFTNARVDRRDMVSGPTDGWKLAMMTFAFERGTGQNAFRFERSVESLADLIRRLDLGTDPIIRQRLAQAKILATIHRLNQQRALSRVRKGDALGPEASIGKLFWSEMDRNYLQELALAVQGMAGALSPNDSHAIDGGAWQEAWLYSQAETIFAGSSEIQRNIIAERVLGLPRSR